MEIWSGLGTLSFRLEKVGKNAPPPQAYVEGAGVWRLIAVSPRIPSRLYFMPAHRSGFIQYKNLQKDSQ